MTGYHRPTVPTGAVHPRRRPLQLGRSEARRSNLNQDVADPGFRERAFFNTHAFRSLVLLPSEKRSHLGRERRRHVFTPWDNRIGPSQPSERRCFKGVKGRATPTGFSLISSCCPSPPPDPLIWRRASQPRAVCRERDRSAARVARWQVCDVPERPYMSTWDMTPRCRWVTGSLDLLKNASQGQRASRAHTSI